MVLSSKFFKYFLMLTLINLNLLLNIDGSNTEEIINIPGNSISNFNLKSNEKKVLEFVYRKDENNRTNYISIFPFDNITIESEIEQLKKNETNQQIFLELNNSNFNKDNLIINITSKNDSVIQIINIVKDKFSSYKNIEDDNEEINIKNIYNFARFLKDENKIQFKINFKEDINATIFYGIVILKSDKVNYIPRVSNFQTNKYGISNETIENGKDIEIKVDNKYKKDTNKSDYPALIVSIETQNKSINYYVTINPKNIMNIFLIISIIIALIFAVITFFLIRRKQNIGTQNVGDEFYGEKSEEEKEN